MLEMSVFGVGYVHAYEVYSHRRCEGVWAHVSKHVEVRGQPWTSPCVCVCCLQKRVLGSLELELQVAVSHTMWVQGTESRFFGRAATLLVTADPTF